MPMQPAILGTARLSNFRLGYRPADLAVRRSSRARVTLGGVDVRARVSGLTISDVLNDAPNMCQLTFDGSGVPRDYRRNVLANGAIGYWRLGEFAGVTADEAGAHPGTVSGGVTRGIAGALSDGTFGMTFNGVNGVVTLSDPAAFPLTLAGSVECWIKYTSGAAGGILGKAWSPSSGWGFAFSAGQIEFDVGGPGGYSVITTINSPPVNDGLWHHLVATWNGASLANGLVLYLDGVLSMYSSFSGPMGSNASPFAIGKILTVIGAFPGSLDEVAIYPNALSAAQVAQQYAIGRGAMVSVPPEVEQPLRITINSDTPELLFSGSLQTVDLSYQGTPEQIAYPCSAIDDGARANRRRPFGTWVQISATTIAQYLAGVAGLSASGVQAALPLVSVILDGTDEMNGALQQLATLIGGYFKWDDGVLYLFQSDASAPPDAIDDTPHRFLDEPPISISVDSTQLRTRQCGKGHTESVLGDVAAGETQLPIPDAVMFNPTGGLAMAGTTPDGAQSQQIAYTGIRLGGAGSLVGPGAAPNAPPVLTRVIAAGLLGSGVYRYAIVHVTAAGKSLPSPVAIVATGTTQGEPVANPAFAPTVDLEDGPGIESGVHKYAYSWVTAAGETLPSPIASVTHGVPAQLAPASIGGAYFYGFSITLPPSTVYSYAYTFRRTSDGAETTLSPTTSANSFDGRGFAIPLAGCQAAPAGYTRVWYRTKAAGGTFYRIPIGSTAGEAGGPDSGGDFLDHTADSLLSAVVAPVTNGTAPCRTKITEIVNGAIVGSGITTIKLWRTPANSAQLKLLASFPADVPVGSIIDQTADGALGANAPVTNTTPVTTTANQISVSGIALGPAATTAREIYRTALNGSQLKLLTTIANNSSTGPFVDNLADGSLGANAPVADTSGIAFAGGQVNAGAVAISTASAAPFPTNGWAIASGGQVIRYTGITGNTLTGIPASGPGALLTTVLFGSQILPAPALIGVTGLGLAMLKGTPVSIWVQRDDLDAQAERAGADRANGIANATGIYDGPPIVDARRGEASLIALCDVTLKLFSRPITTVTYATRDPKTKSGKTVHFNVATPRIGPFDLTIQSVDISEIDTTITGTAPRRNVVASSVRWSLADLLRQLITQQAAR
jgi:hypothetical protein